MVTWLRPRRSAITFDLGGAGLRAFQLRRQGRQPALCDALELVRAPVFEDDEPVAPPLEAAQLSRLIGQGRFTGRDVALVLSPPDVQFFPIHLPDQALAQPPERIEQALKWEVSQESRDAAEGLEVRHWRLPAGRGQQANVMAVVMPMSRALEWHELLWQHNLYLRRIDVSPCALVRLAQCLWTPESHDLWGVLDLGLRHATLTVVVGTTPAYIRSLSVSPHRWTQQLSAAFEVDYPVAEQLLRDHRVHPTDRGYRATNESERGRRAQTNDGERGPVAGQPPAGSQCHNKEQHALMHAGDLSSALSSVLRESLHRLAQEVGRCFSYVMQSFPDHGVTRLLLAGGGADLQGLPAVLEAELDLPVARLATDPGVDTLTPAGSRCHTEEHPPPQVQFKPQAAAALGGAMLELETP